MLNPTRNTAPFHHILLAALESQPFLVLISVTIFYRPGPRKTDTPKSKNANSDFLFSSLAEPHGMIVLLVTGRERISAWCMVHCACIVRVSGNGGVQAVRDDGKEGVAAVFPERDERVDLRFGVGVVMEFILGNGKVGSDRTTIANIERQGCFPCKSGGVR